MSSPDPLIRVIIFCTSSGATVFLLTVHQPTFLRPATAPCFGMVAVSVAKDAMWLDPPGSSG
jgi:hypothetical protein